MEKYVDKHGNFTHTKLIGTQEQFEQQLFELFEKFQGTSCYKGMTLPEKVLLAHSCQEAARTGYIPQGLLLMLVMPPAHLKPRYEKIPQGTEIKFDLPPRFQKEKEECQPIQDSLQKS